MKTINQNKINETHAKVLTLLMSQSSRLLDLNQIEVGFDRLCSPFTEIVPEIMLVFLNYANNIKKEQKRNETGICLKQL